MKKRTKTYFDEFTDNFKNNKVFVYVWICLVTFTSLFTFIQNGNSLLQWFNSNVFEKNRIYKQIENLNTKVNIVKFTEVLGTPSIIRPDQSDLKKTIYIFVNKYYFIQANTDENKNVLSFSVTSRRSDFTPTFHVKSAYFDKDLTSVTLNKDVFLKDSDQPAACYYEWWPKGFTYIEGRYLGGDGDYQSLFVGINDTGSLNMKGFNIFKNNEESSDCSTIPLEFRKSNTFNTFMLSNDSSESALIKNKMIYRIGVDQFDVSTLR